MPSLSMQIAKRIITDDRYHLLRSIGTECISEADLKHIVEKKPNIICYDGFEPSGRMHIAQGILRSINTNKCTASGCKFTFWVADWFALMNDKMGGELDRIRVVGHYFLEIWKSVGMNMDDVSFFWASDVINQHAEEYWQRVCDIGRRNTLSRIKKCCTIMGKKGDSLTGAQIMYPLMQCSDILQLQADVCQLGQDQRKVNMLCREYCDQIGRKFKPVVLSHNMLSGLLQGQAKMSKSNSMSAIFMEDRAEDVEFKIRNAYCPKVRQSGRDVIEDGLTEGSEDTNPVLDYYNALVFSIPGASVNCGGKVYKSYKELEHAFIGDEIAEEQLKGSLIGIINTYLDPVRRHFNDNVKARELLETICNYKKESVVMKMVERAFDIPRIVAWLPVVSHLPLNIALGIVSRFKSFLEAHNNGEGVLVLPDLSAFARNELTGDLKDINAVLNYNAALMKFFGLNEKVRVAKQSDLIAKNSSDYWIAAINFGRKYCVSQLEEVLGGEVRNAGYIIGALMRYADVLMVNASETITIEQYDGKQNELVNDFFEKTCPTQEIPHFVPDLSNDTGKGVVFNPDHFLFVDDGDMDIRRKIKKAFAAEMDADNAVVSIMNMFLNKNKGVIVKRSTENGGDLTLGTVDELVNKYNEGGLHPSDLKAAVTEQLMQFTEEARKALKTSEVKKWAQRVKMVDTKFRKADHTTAS